MAWRHPVTWLGVLVVAALALRLVYLHQAADSPFFDAPAVDARSYVESARALASGAWLGPAKPFWQSPIYPYLLAASSALGGDLLLPRLLQALAGAVVCAALWLLGRVALSPGVGWLAAGMAAIYGPFVYFGGELLPTIWAVLFDLLALLALLWAARGHRAGPWLVAGLLLGVSALAVANTLLFVPVAAGWAWRWGGGEAGWGPATRQRVLRLLGFALGVALVVGPVTLRNWLVGGEWVLVSHNVGVNFYIGNNPDVERTLAARPGEEWLELVNLPEREAGITQPGAASNYFLARSWDYITSEPVGYLGLLARKTYQLWQAEELPRNLSPYAARQYSPLLQGLLWRHHALAFPFGLVAPLALVGLACFVAKEGRRNPAGLLILLFTVTYGLSVVLFFVSGRHRLPLVPCLLLFSAYGTLQLVRWRGRRLALGMAALFLLLIAVNGGTAAEDPRRIAFEHYSLGAVYESKGMEVNALQHYRRAVALDPRFERALLGLANMLGLEQRYDQVADVWRQLLTHHPEREDVRLRLADLLLLTGEVDEAIANYDTLLAGNPGRVELYGRLGHAYSRVHRYDEAEAAYQEILALRPDSALVHLNLGKVREAQGDSAGAADAYERLLGALPGHVEGMARLAGVLSSAGETGRAEALVAKALELQPDHALAHWQSGMLAARRHEYDEAIRHFTAILENDPGDLQARRALAHMLLKIGQRPRADAEYARYERALQRQRMQRETVDVTRRIAEQLLQQTSGAPGSMSAGREGWTQ